MHRNHWPVLIMLLGSLWLASLALAADKRGGQPPSQDNSGAQKSREGWKVPVVNQKPPDDNPPPDDHHGGGKPPDDRPPGDRPHGDGPGGRPPRDGGHGGHGGGSGGWDVWDRGPGWDWGPTPGPGWGRPGHGFPHYWPTRAYRPYVYPYDWDYPRSWEYPRLRDDDAWRDYDPATAPGPHLVGRIVGAEIWAADGVFLGVIDPDRNNADSICNPDGAYGSFASDKSILNPRCEYGVGRGPLSCWDPDTRTPPRLFWHGRFVGYLSANRALSPRTDPAWVLRRWATTAG